MTQSIAESYLTMKMANIIMIEY